MSALLLPAIATSGPPLTNVVHHADALALLNALPSGSVDAVITDPPYGLYGNAIVMRPDTGEEYNRVNELWDMTVPILWMKAVERVLKPNGSVLCFGVRQSIYALAYEGLRLGWRLVNDITWQKPDATPNFSGRMMTESTERILWFCPDGKNWTYNRVVAKSMNYGNNLRDVWTFKTVHDNRQHPTQKPLELMKRMVELFTNEGDTVVDLFCGSGTTLVACQELKRQFIGGDSHLPYVEIARHRLATSTLPLPLFEAS